MTTPRELLDTSIAQLWTLTRFFGEQLSEGREGAEPARAETCMPRDSFGPLGADSEASGPKGLKCSTSGAEASHCRTLITSQLAATYPR